MNDQRPEYDHDNELEALHQSLQQLSSFEDVLPEGELDSVQKQYARSAEVASQDLDHASPFTFANKYRLVKRLGGGMSDVFLAEQINLGHKRVVIKILDAESEKRKTLFKGESETLGKLTRLNNPNLLVPIDQGIAEDVAYIVTEYIEGDDLRTLFVERRLSDSAVLKVVYDIAKLMAEVHRAGIVHGDIKPSNIMVSKKGVTKLIDFGLSSHWQSHVNAQPSFAGTVGYASPEQHNRQTVDHRSDIYSLGVVLDELVLELGITEQADELESLIQQMTAVHADRRIQAMDEVAKQLRELRSKFGEPKRSRWVDLVIGFVLALLVFVIWGVVNWLVPPDAQQPNRLAEAGDSKAEDVSRDLEFTNWIINNELHVNSSRNAIRNGAWHRRILVRYRVANESSAHWSAINENNQPFPRDMKIVDVGFDHPTEEFVNQLNGLDEIEILKLADAPIEDWRIIDGSNLRFLEYVGSDANSESFYSILDRAPLETLHLGNWGGSHADVTPTSLQEIYSRCKNLRHLVLRNMPLRDDWLENIEQLNDLQSLNLDFTQVSDKALSHIAKLPALEKLSIIGTAVTDEGLRHLENLSPLIELHVNQTPIRGTGLSHLSTQKITLKKLSIGGPNFDRESLKNIIELRFLDELLIDYGFALNDEDVDLLAQLRSIQKIQINGTQITEEGQKRLAKELGRSPGFVSVLPTDARVAAWVVLNKGEVEFVNSDGQSRRTVTSLEQLYQNQAPKLVTINLTNCTEIDEQQLVEQFTSLDQLGLVLYRPGELSPETVGRLRERFPDCQFLSD